ncbi:MAG: hypothetical protein LH615_14005 [Ferruginibacter sp.]|nr:hypothetical protein [Ferruginibacter sp.]
MRKILILSFIIIITIGLTYSLIYYVGMQSFLFAWVLNLMLMMCVFKFTEALKSKFSSTYYNEKKWELRGKIYGFLGINFFRKLLVWIGWERLNKKSNPIEKNTKSLIHLQYRTKQSELGHIIIMVIVLGFNVFVAFKFGIPESLWLLILNVLLNLYPIFLQRYNRPRLDRAINLIKHREGRSHNSVLPKVRAGH